MQIRLSWKDPVTGEQRSPILNTPIAIGRDFAQLPADIEGRRVSRIQLNDEGISRLHALLIEENGRLIAIDQNSSNGLSINDQPQLRGALNNGDRLSLGSHQLLVSQIEPVASTSKILFNPITNIPDPHITKPGNVSSELSFRPQIFQQQEVSLEDLQATGLNIEVVDYAAVGGGFGSFAWVDLLRIAGVKSSQIVVLSPEKSVYGRYHQLCRHAHIAAKERTRSAADACPDNPWGFPSYAAREATQKLARGQLQESLRLCWQVLAEPLFGQHYGPTDEQILKAVDREVARISWQSMLRYALVQSIRKTTDGRYALLFNRGDSYALVIAKYVHLATGYPAIEFLPDLQQYRQQTKDFKSVVNAYENHDHIYEKLSQQGGTIMLRGEGSIAGRILQSIYEVRRAHPEKKIEVLHLWPTAKAQGQQYGLAQRPVHLGYEIQTLEWPKSCWGGPYKITLADATPEQQVQLLQSWSGPTIPPAQDWHRILSGGISKGWYRQIAGTVQQVMRQSTGSSLSVMLQITPASKSAPAPLVVDYIIDATGRPGTVMDSELLADLVQHYHLPLNRDGAFPIEPDFEILSMRSQDIGRVYGAGSITAGDGYGPVDSFLGLQYAALAAICSLTDADAAGLQELSWIKSGKQWLNWLLNKAPN
jgi:pSer/pThr/pTyr-binding forkhead associated (FHA) protein